ncbi:2,3-diaminopropionate biosynthesis protein SbnB [Paenibacillus gorillae]|uniref:2,3-diaminopropionate biosynthesis protein SbnB n=1 Tax=Paenibacillus gorillae TaxID=1243662 RepID=UPI0004B0FE81|nr:2,3-diaminopropionate biosynthesis protein SbnB [Paenibacillus gorillae]
MLYVTEKDLINVGVHWPKLISVINDAVKCLNNKDYVQPIKPYLRYRNLKNRLIAMPAFIGGTFNITGIKWISSFPGNIEKGFPRAHSVVILNDVETGQPLAIFNTPMLSVIRTASVSGLVLNWFDKVNNLENVKLGVIGWGPIGQYHLRMCAEILGNRISEVYLFDSKKNINKDEIDYIDIKKITIVNHWEEAYVDSDVFITCTVSDKQYINKQPKDNSLHLNISLRDYLSSTFKYFSQSIIVDDWEEVCRENTDIEKFHHEKGLTKK